jgi:hypothetical protein
MLRHGADQVRQKWPKLAAFIDASGSHMTQRWSEMDSNPRSPERNYAFRDRRVRPLRQFRSRSRDRLLCDKDRRFEIRLRGRGCAGELVQPSLALEAGPCPKTSPLRLLWAASSSSASSRRPRLKPGPITCNAGLIHFELAKLGVEDHLVFAPSKRVKKTACM